MSHIVCNVGIVAVLYHHSMGHIVCTVGIVAVSCGENFCFGDRVDLMSRLILNHHLILIWSFADPIHPVVSWIGEKRCDTCNSCSLSGCATVDMETHFTWLITQAICIRNLLHVHMYLHAHTQWILCWRPSAHIEHLYVSTSIRSTYVYKDHLYLKNKST